MNNQNKKKHISMQGYYAASSIEFLNIMMNMIDNRTDYIKMLGKDYNKIINYLMLSANKSLYQNLESISHYISKDISNKIFITVLNTLHSKVSYDNILDSFTFELNNRSPKNDTLRWYLKNNNNFKSAFNKINQIKKESFIKYINKKIVNLSEMAITIGWLLGCGDIKYISKLKGISRYFAIIYKLSIDFQNIEHDILSSNGISKNYVVNYGLQDSYEYFMDNKQKFIEEAMLHDIYTSTIKEILNNIENKVEAIIDETSPDIKSSVSSRC
jgi:hypothetical protein